ncbi:MAG: GNAT family N-acetyltransferase [Vicinamibacteria bacterium]|jgi:GNAT superfamily N-acetyltransferase
MNLIDALLHPFRRRTPVERIVLDDGREVTLSPLTPAAKPLIAKGIERVSPESSRRRFFTVRRRFSERELDEMTTLDGWNRYAIGATAASPEGPVGAAIARFSRAAEDPTSAEVALLVVDDFQHHGLGRILLARIAEAASARGIERFTALVLRDNEPMLSMLRHYAPDLSIADAGEHYRIDVPLPHPSLWSSLTAA